MSQLHRSVAVEAANRKLIRPSLTELKEKVVEAKRGPVQPPARIKPPTGPPQQNKVAQGPPQQQQKPPQHTAQQPNKGGPPEQTNAENFYYAKQIQNKTPMIFVLRDGDKVHGRIEWYDKHCLRIARDSEPHLLIYKANIRFMYKDE
jgi:sRNA-binding regulator protein Hfq